MSGSISKTAGGEISPDQIADLLSEVSISETKVFPLMKLPAPLREQILEHLFEGAVIRVFLPGRNGDPPTPIALPVTARVGNRQLRQETIRVGLMVTTLEIHSFRGNTKLQQWLSCIDLRDTSKNYVKGFDAVKKLRFPYFSRFPHKTYSEDTPHSDLKLAKKCGNLRELSILFVPQEVYNYRAPMSAGDYEPQKAAEQLRREYRMNEILTLKSLEVLKFEGHCGMDPNNGIRELATWFKANFDAQKEAGERKNGVKVLLPAGYNISPW